MKTYTTTVGLEVHAELKTRTKMFCNSLNDPHAGEPNTHVCPICMGHPGTLPVINKTAVQHVLRVGLALQGELATYTEFDRKNYFYPDIPKGYQISQYKYPLVKGGVLCGIAITRIHLEEDTARSLHDQGEGSIIDYNRAGVPLMELVTEPVIHDAKSAGNFARELQLLFRTLHVSDANMEKGEMRVEANISVSATNEFGTKVEVKNLNSFRSVESAIAYEVKRQIEVLDNGGNVIQETRGWDETKGKTYSQRVKESANDYRYFPDPDLPKLNTQEYEEFSLARLSETMPVLPDKKREKYRNLGLTIEQIEILISSMDVSFFFEESLNFVNGEHAVVKLIANYLISDLLPILEMRSIRIEACNADFFVRLMSMVHDGLITSRVAKDILVDVVVIGFDPAKLVAERGLLQNSSEDTLIPLVHELILNNSHVANEYKNGKDSALQFLVGQGMRLSKGSANPSLLAKLVERIVRGS